MASNTFYIPKPALFSFNECLWYLDRGYDDCLHRIHDKRIEKALVTEGGTVLFGIEDAGEQIAVTIMHGGTVPRIAEYIIHYVTGWFDLAADLAPFYARLQADEVLAYMPLKFKGLRLMGIPDLFEALCWSIIGQQINLSFAYKLKRRLVEAYGRKLVFSGRDYHLFPDPHSLASADYGMLREMQFSGRKAEYIIGLAGAFQKGLISKEMLTALPGPRAQQAALTSIRGIGTWTANYALMKSLRVPGSIPHGDAGLLNALLAHGIISHRGESEKINSLFGAYKGFENYLVLYLWRSLADKPERY